MADAEKYAQWIVANQDKQGTPEFETVAQAYQAAKKQPSPEATERQKLQSHPLMRVVQGARDPIDAGAQLLPRGLEYLSSAGGLAPNSVSEWFGSEANRVDKGISDNEREYEAARKATGSEGFDAARFVGNVVSPANAAVGTRLPAATTTGKRILTGFGVGALGGAMQPVDTEQNPDFASTKIAQTGIGAAGGAIASPILGKAGDLIGSGVANLRKPSDSFVIAEAQKIAQERGVSWGSLAQSQKDDLANQVRQSLAKVPMVDSQAAARKMDFDAEGMPYLLGQVTRDPQQFAREKNLSQLAGTGDPITETFMQQGRQMREKIGGLAGNAKESQVAGVGLADALRNYDQKLSREVSQAYQEARKSVGKDADVPMQGLAQDFANVVDTFGDKVPSAVVRNFQKYGIAPGGDMTQRKIFTVEEADKLLKVINSNQSSDPATNKALAALRDSVKNSVTQDAGVSDVFSPARAAAASRFRLQEAVPALEAAASGSVNPDDFVQKFIVGSGAKTDQVRGLASILKSEAPEQFQEAKSQIGTYLQRQAFGENSAGDKAFSPERFAKALRSMGEKKLGAFYEPKEIESLQRLSRIGAYIDSVPNASKPNTSGNWGAITKLIPGVPTTIAIANTLRNGVNNQLDVSRATSGKLPAKLSTEDIKLISQVLSGATAATGGYSAEQLK